MTRTRRLFLALTGLAVAMPRPVAGQLLSPGKLSAVHAELDGVRECTACHELRQRGVSDALCLSCHEPLAARIEAGEGYHGRLEDTACGTCHKEHLGRDFDVRRFDEADFDHAEAGYDLRGAHAEAECGSCHEEARIRDADVLAFKGEHDALDRTFLGLPVTCASCHEDDSEHGDQFADRACSDCHDEVRWEDPVGFDHDDARFRLDGEHRDVECADCHRSEGDVVRYRPLEFGDCSACHEDGHDGRMEGACSSCHSTAGWRRVGTTAMRDRFDHSMTRFALHGAHGELTCEACHRRGAPPVTATVAIRYRPGTERFLYPRPLFEACASCHVNYHEGSFEDVIDGTECSSCHSEDAWSPSTFGIRRHDDVPEFQLTGAHRATPCVACHQAPFDDPETPHFRIDDYSCAACHVEDSPHEDRFGDLTCDTCHDTEAFEVEEFDHDAPAVASLIETCSSCHADDDPHQGQFEGRECGSCHGTSAFTIEDFDHSVARFSLDGAHVRLSCDACHITETPETGVSFTRYRPLGRECVDCHGEGS